MATPDVRAVLKVDGRLCWNPTDLSTTYPFGGTALGLVRAAAVRLTYGVHRIRAEEFGGIPVDAVYVGEEYVFAGILSAWDKDAIGALFLDTATGAATGRKVRKSRAQTDSVRAGTLVSTAAGTLYFSPVADQHPGVLFHWAIPMPEESSRWEFNLANEFGLPVVFLATPDSSGNICQVGLRGDLSL